MTTDPSQNQKVCPDFLGSHFLAPDYYLDTDIEH